MAAQFSGVAVIKRGSIAHCLAKRDLVSQIENQILLVGKCSQIFRCNVVQASWEAG